MSLSTTHRSSEPFFYLESSIVFTVSQCKLIEGQLLTKVQYQVQAYSQCQISLKGCATVMSILLLSSIVTVYTVILQQTSKCYLRICIAVQTATDTL